MTVSDQFLSSMIYKRQRGTSIWQLRWSPKTMADTLPLTLTITMDGQVNINGQNSPSTRDLQNLPLIKGSTIPAKLEGHLTTLDGMAIPGDTITLISPAGRWTRIINAESGHFSFSKLPPDLYLLHTQSQVGFATILRTISLNPGESRAITLGMGIPERICDYVFVRGVISGLVFIGDRIPFPGVTVSLESPKKYCTLVQTTDNGEFFFHRLKEGLYYLRFQAPGYQDILRVVRLYPQGEQPPTEVTFPWPWEKEDP